MIGENQAPAIPDELKDKQKALETLFDKHLELWLESKKNVFAETATSLAVANTRDDTEKETQVKRADKLAEVSQARIDTDRANEEALVKSIHDAYVEVTKESLERSLSRINVLSACVTAVISLYTGLLALVYAAKPGEGAPLDLTAVVPALFLGLSLVLIAYYAAAFKKTMTARALLPSGIGGTLAENRLRTFMAWCFAGVLDRAYSLRAAIISLGLGVAALPLPFVDVPWWVVLSFSMVGLLGVVLMLTLGRKLDTATGDSDIRKFR